MSPAIMGSTTQDPYIQKEHTKLYKILKFRVNWANIEQDTAVQKLQNLVTNVWIAGHLSGNPYISLQILKFLNGRILFNIGPINTKLKDFVKLGVLFLNIWSCVVNPIIHGLLPRTPTYEIRQLSLILPPPVGGKMRDPGNEVVPLPRGKET